MILCLSYIFGTQFFLKGVPRNYSGRGQKKKSVFRKLSHSL